LHTYILWYLQVETPHILRRTYTYCVHEKKLELSIHLCACIRKNEILRDPCAFRSHSLQNYKTKKNIEKLRFFLYPSKNVFAFTLPVHIVSQYTKSSDTSSCLFLPYLCFFLLYKGIFDNIFGKIIIWLSVWKNCMGVFQKSTLHDTQSNRHTNLYILKINLKRQKSNTRNIS